MTRFALLAALLVSSTRGLQRVSIAPWCIPRGGAAAVVNYSAQLEGVKSVVMDKAMNAVSTRWGHTCPILCGCSPPANTLLLRLKNCECP
jgi:hypothetical protein